MCLYTVPDCWQLGRANDEDSVFILPFTTFVPEDGWTTLAFDDWNFNYVDPEDPSTFVTGWKYFGHGTPSSWSSSSHEAVLSSSNATGNAAEFFLGRYCANMFGWSCRNRYLFLEEESIAVHPGDQKVFLRWTSPLNGTCDVDFYAIGSEDVTWGGFGIDGAETTTTVMLMHNHTLVSDISISVYTDISPLQQSVTVVGGDILDIVVSGNQSLAQWTGLNGGITCDFDDGTE